VNALTGAAELETPGFIVGHWWRDRLADAEL